MRIHNLSSYISWLGISQPRKLDRRKSAHRRATGPTGATGTAGPTGATGGGRNRPRKLLESTEPRAPRANRRYWTRYITLQVVGSIPQPPAFSPATLTPASCTANSTYLPNPGCAAPQTSVCLQRYSSELQHPSKSSGDTIGASRPTRPLVGSGAGSPGNHHVYQQPAFLFSVDTHDHSCNRGAQHLVRHRRGTLHLIINVSGRQNQLIPFLRNC